jgi:DNA-binding CsgD family transcriptional regulator/tetratricopeptide (TPR) repeat protein
MLDIVSVMPGRSERSLLERLAVEPDAAIAECVGAGMLVPTTQTVAFRHELARRAWESTLEPAAAAGLHLRVLDALLERGVSEVGAARLVHHAERANAIEQVLWLAPAAAREAAALGAHKEAAAQYAVALRHAAALPSPDRAELLEGYAYEVHLTGEMDAAIVAAESALALRASLGDRRREGADLRLLSRVAWYQGDRARAVERGEAAIRVLEPLGTTTELAMAYSNISQLHMLANDAEPAIHWGRQAMSLSKQVDDQRTFAHALINVGAAELMNGSWDKGWSLVQGALDLALDNGSHEHAVRAHTLLACQSIVARDYETATRTVNESLRYARENDIDTFVHYLLGWRAQLHLDMGQWTDADRDADAVLRERQVSTVMRFPALAVAGLLRARRGEPGADTMLDEALAFASRSGELQRIAPAAIARAEAAWLAGDPETACSTALAGYEVARVRRSPWYTGALAFWLWRCGGLEQVPDSAAKPYRLQASGNWREAADAWARIGSPYERALALADGDDDARREAFDILEGLGARATIGALRRDLRGRGVRTLPRGPRQTTRKNPAGLTAGQMKVLALLARGLPNSEIARQLYLSPRTVDHHVSAILAKLGVHARGEAAAAAREKGLVV